MKLLDPETMCIIGNILINHKCELDIMDEMKKAFIGKDEKMEYLIKSYYYTSKVEEFKENLQEQI